MVELRLRVVIDNEAKKFLREAYQHIKKDSVQNAEQVRDSIKASLLDLIKILNGITQTNTGSITTVLTVPMNSNLTASPITCQKMRSGLSKYATRR